MSDRRRPVIVSPRAALPTGEGIQPDAEPGILARLVWQESPHQIDLEAEAIRGVDKKTRPGVFDE